MQHAFTLLLATATAALVATAPAAQAAVPFDPPSPSPSANAVTAAKASKPSFAATKKAGRKAVRAALKETKSTSASVALVSGDKTVWSQTFGRVDKSGAKPSPTDTYGTGSVSKMVTTIAVMQLVDQGKVSLDAPVTRYVNDFSMLSPQYRQITVRMLLNHSAGLPGTDYADGVSFAPILGYPDRVLAGLRNSHLKTTPGAMNVYCNDCFTLAGIVVERVSGTPFDDYVAANIWKPLGMRHSFYTSTMPKRGTYAPVLVDGKPEPFEVTNIWASGGLNSTSRDMARLARVFTGDGVVRGKRILSSSAISQMSVDQTATTLRAGNPGGFRYGLGWDTMQDPALKSAGVRGWTKGGDVGQYHAGFVVAPDQELAAVVEGAGYGFSSTSAERIAHTILFQALRDTGAIENLPKQVKGKPAKDLVTSRLAKRKAKRMAGIYLSHGTSIKLSPGKRGSLILSTGSDGSWTRAPGRLVLRNDRTFWGTQIDASFRTVKAWGRTYLVQRRIGGTGTYYTDNASGQRVRSSGSLSPEWRERVGQKWLLANEAPSSMAWVDAATTSLKIAAIPGLSGYLWAAGTQFGSVPFNAMTSDTLGTMFLQVPLLNGRDLYDFEFTKRNGEEFLTFDSSVLRPVAKVPALSPGSNQVTIGTEGLVEWRKLTSAASIRISGQSNWKLFDKDLSLIDSGGSTNAKKNAPAGAFLAVFGRVGQAAHVVVK
ncbi:MAG: serine hydrolase domain-containing protein [Candidatus Nanopelagicales bacterium]